MMRKVFSVGLMAFAFGLVQSANAGVTFDVVFQDATAPTGITIAAGDAGTGCAFGGAASGSVATGYCMDVMISIDQYRLTSLGTSVGYDSDNGLALLAAYNVKSIPAGAGTCNGITASVLDTGSRLESFDCLVGPPNKPPSVATGTYKIGTIVWDTSGTDSGTETVAAVIRDGLNGVGAIINGNIVTLGSADIVVGTHILTIIPEPGTASLLGLGLVGLILAGRRSRA